jgi:anti-sigma factor RsiW
MKTDEIMALIDEMLLVRGADVTMQRDAVRSAIEALQHQVVSEELMAECMRQLREDCIEAGVMSAAVPPMMYSDEIIARLLNAATLQADAARYRKCRRNGAFFFSSDHMTESEIDARIDWLPDAATEQK